MKKFDFVIGNPPYQEITENTSDRPVYHKFMDMAYGVGNKVMMVTPGRFLFDAGKTPKEWNQKMLNDEHFTVLNYNPKSIEIFSNTNIKGGIAISYRDKDKNFGALEVYTPFEELNSIRKKVCDSKFETIMGYMNTTYKFNLEALYTDYPEYKSQIGSGGNEKRLISNVLELLDCFHNEKLENDIEIKGVINNIRVNKYIDKKYIDLLHITFGKYKVIIPASNGSGEIGEVLSTPLVVGPLVGYTQTFISVGCFNEESEAKACLKYIKTKFARVMLGIKKITQSNTIDKWKYVPIQNFTESSDIDWSKTISEIDKQLYKKYNLSEDEIKFIEEQVCSMEIVTEEENIEE